MTIVYFLAERLGGLIIVYPISYLIARYLIGYKVSKKSFLKSFVASWLITSFVYLLTENNSYYAILSIATTTIIIYIFAKKDNEVKYNDGVGV